MPLACTHLVVHVCATAHLPMVMVVGALCGPALSELEGHHRKLRTKRAMLLDMYTIIYDKQPLHYNTVPYRSYGKN